MYGGRVIDSYDQRIVNTLMEEYFGEFIIDEFQQFYFYRDKKFQYILPPVGVKEDYIGKYMIYVLFSCKTEILFRRD